MRSLIRTLVIEVLIAYCVGMACAGVLSILAFGIIGAFAAVVGFFVGLPILLFAFVIVGMFPAFVVRRKKLLCLIVPFIVAIGWLGYEFAFDYAERGFSWGEYISMYHVHQRLALAFVFPLSVSIAFYRRTRGLELSRPSG